MKALHNQQQQLTRNVWCTNGYLQWHYTNKVPNKTEQKEVLVCCVRENDQETLIFSTIL